MRERIIRRYSVCFKQQVIEDLESGRLDSLSQAQKHYGIEGASTLRRWLRQYGKNHLQAKVVRVQKPDEVEQIDRLKRRVNELERALGRTQAQSLLNAAYLELACEQLGQEVEGFKKSSMVGGSPGR